VRPTLGAEMQRCSLMMSLLAKTKGSEDTIKNSWLLSLRVFFGDAK
jgi:hypothetical protein